VARKVRAVVGVGVVRELHEASIPAELTVETDDALDESARGGGNTHRRNAAHPSRHGTVCKGLRPVLTNEAVVRDETCLEVTHTGNSRERCGLPTHLLRNVGPVRAWSVTRLF